jgi:hypothetical protein
MMGLWTLTQDILIQKNKLNNKPKAKKEGFVMETKTKTKRQIIKSYREAWGKVNYALSSVGWGQYGKQYLKENLDEERSHRGFKPDHVKAGLTINESAELFAIQQIAEALADKPKWTPDLQGYLSCRKSIYTAWSLVINYRHKIAEALKGVDLDEIRALDYAELVKE